jgi:hypothetical protein
LSEKLLNIHEILKNAALDNKDEEADQSTVATFRVKSKDKLLAETICKTNGADLSKFLRGCVRQLVTDYTGQQS